MVIVGLGFLVWVLRFFWFVLNTAHYFRVPVMDMFQTTLRNAE